MKKKMNKKGFTLAEVLIVVAIIAVLVAVSIPVFTSKLERAREATDVANMRAAKAAAVVEYLDEKPTYSNGAAVYYYDADNGVLSTSKPSDAYGKGTAVNGGIKYTDYDNKAHTADVIKVTITQADGSVKTEWVAK